MSSPIAVILGAGPNNGQAIARHLAEKGYKLALVSRGAKEENSTSSELHIRADFSDPSSIPYVFEDVKAKLGIPSVVIYNAAQVNITDPEDPFSLPVYTLSEALNVNAVSAYAAAKEAVAAFKDLPSSSKAPPTFILTGNITNTQAFPAFLDLGVGKNAAAHFVEIASIAYGSKYKFYYADQRHEDGAPMIKGAEGEAHGKYFAELVLGDKQEHWHQTFVDGIGYKKF